MRQLKLSRMSGQEEKREEQERRRSCITNIKWTKGMNRRREDVNERERKKRENKKIKLTCALESKITEKTDAQSGHASNCSHISTHTLMVSHPDDSCHHLPWTVNFTTLLRPEPIPFVIWHRYDAESERVTAFTASEPFWNTRMWGFEMTGLKSDGGFFSNPMNKTKAYY